MARCPVCQRRLAVATRCPADGGIAPESTSDAAAPVPPAVEGFAISRLLGSGGFGSVWEASDAAGARVAVKVSHAADRNDALRVKREADALSRVGPPFVPALHGSGKLSDGRWYVAMERLFGRTLAEQMEAWPGPPPLTTIKAIGGALLESAAALHLAGVLHRDLKPENVFLIGDNPLVAKWMDFGLARAEAAPRDAHVTAAAGAGTPEYMSPEQLSALEADLRSDVYSLGIILFELATLRLPFAGDRRAIEYGHVSLRPPRPSRFAAVCPPLERVILTCLAKDRARRFADAEVLRIAFAEALADVDEGAGASASLSRAPANDDAPEVPAPPAARPAERRAPQAASEREKVALLFVQGSPMSAKQVQSIVETFGGQLAQAGTGRAVCAFRHRGGDSPGQRALSAGEALVAKGMAERVRVDAGAVVVRARPDGPPRLIGSLFDEAQRYPKPSDPPGLRLTMAGRAILPALPCRPAPEEPDLFVLAPSEDDTGGTPNRTLTRDAAPLFGRGDVVRGLVAEAERAISDRRPRVARLLADPGVGKTRLGVELAHQLRAKHPGAQVIELRVREPLGHNADETLAELLRRAADLPAARPHDGGRALLGERLGELGNDGYVATALVLGWIDPGDPAVQALRAAPGVLRAGVARVGMTALRRLAAKCPVVVIVDDAHWADDALLDALEQATVSESPLWLCALARPTFAEVRPTWGMRAAHLHSVELGPLDREGASELCRYLLLPATNVPEPLIERLVDRAQAVPLLLCDLVNGLRRQGLVKKRAGDVWYVAAEMLDGLPDSFVVEWIAARELDELPKDLSAHARLVSLLVPEFTWEEAEGVLATMDDELGSAFPLDARVGTERLGESRLLVQHRSGRYGFRSAIAREAVAKMVPDALRTRVHRAALAYYRGAPIAENARLQRLAWHAAQAGERAEAASTYSTLAELARERHIYLEAELLYTQALSQIDEADPMRRLPLLKGRGVSRYRLGRYDGSLVDLAQARELAARGGDAAVLADVMLEESTALDWLFEWRRSRELAEQARDLVANCEDDALRARSLLAVGRSLHRFSHDEEAAPLLREATVIAARRGDEGYEVEVDAQLMLGFLLPLVGLLDEAEERLTRASVIAEGKGDEFHLAAAWNNRSCLSIARNDRERFIEDNQRVLDFSRRMGNAHLERNANLNAAYFFYWRAEFAAAEPFARRMIEVDEHYFRQGGFQPVGAVLLARILWGLGDAANACALVDEVIAQQASVRGDGKSELLLQPSDELLLDMIASVVHGADAAAWEKVVQRARSVAQGQELIEVLELAGVEAHRRGDPAEARRWWDEALVLGERIPNVMSGRIRDRVAALG